jgi:hypothetical protein
MPIATRKSVQDDVYNEIINDDNQSTPVLVIGRSGGGKSSAIVTLPPKNTFIINVLGKDLPFRGWRKNYTPWKPNGKGNMLRSNDYDEIDNAFGEIADRKEIKYVVIDDFQYLMAGEFMRRAYEDGWNKWTQIGKHAYDLLIKARSLGAGKFVFFLAHSETNEQGEVDVKTLGKLLSEKIIVAGMFTVVLQCVVEKDKYYFRTKNSDGKSVLKSPVGMFSTPLIHNDLKYVADAIIKYENE